MVETLEANGKTHHVVVVLRHWYTGVYSSLTNRVNPAYLDDESGSVLAASLLCLGLLAHGLGHLGQGSVSKRDIGRRVAPLIYEDQIPNDLTV